MKILLYLLFFIFIFDYNVQAGVVVKLGNTNVLELSHGIGAFTIEERAKAIDARLKSLAKDRAFNQEKLKIEEFENSTNILFEDRVIVTITDRDARASSLDRKVLGQVTLENISKSISDYKKSSSWKSYAVSVSYVILSTLILFFLLRFIVSAFPRVVEVVKSWSLKFVPSIKIKSFELLPSSRVISFSVFLIKAIKIFLIFLLLYLYIPLVFSFFPYTSDWADKIFGYVANPLKNIAKVIIDYIPNLFFIGVIVVLTSYLLRFLNFIFLEIERGSIKFNGFYQEWAAPTYKLVRFLVLAFTLVVVFPYLPGSGSPAFQGISVFLGILLSLGSTSAIANIIGGIVLTYMRPFKVGDRVKIGETEGDVIEKSLLVTRVKTVKNVDITVPNSMVLSSHLVNFSSSAKENGLILHSTVTIGYDVDWREVHELLISAAQKVPEVLKDPSPFVLQKSLDDFYVSYEINAYTDKPHLMSKIYSELHKNIQEEFKNANVEIMSPHFSAIRDGSYINIPVNKGETQKYVSSIRVSTDRPQ